MKKEKGGEVKRRDGDITKEGHCPGNCLPLPSRPRLRGMSRRREQSKVDAFTFFALAGRASRVTGCYTNGGNFRPGLWIGELRPVSIGRSNSSNVHG